MNMTQDELDALPDVTPEIVSEERIIPGGKCVRILVQKDAAGALSMATDGEITHPKTGTRYMIGWLNGIRVKRRSNTWT